MRIHRVRISLKRNNNHLIPLLGPISSTIHLLTINLAASPPVPLDAGDHNIRPPTQTITRVDSPRISLELRVVIRALDVAIAFQMRAGRMVRLEGRPGDRRALPVFSASTCRGPNVGLAVLGMHSPFAVPVVPLVRPDVVGVVVFHHELSLELFVDPAVLEERLHRARPGGGWFFAIASAIIVCAVYMFAALAFLVRKRTAGGGG